MFVFKSSKSERICWNFYPEVNDVNPPYKVSYLLLWWFPAPLPGSCLLTLVDWGIILVSIHFNRLWKRRTLKVKLPKFPFHTFGRQSWRERRQNNNAMWLKLMTSERITAQFQGTLELALRLLIFTKQRVHKRMDKVLDTLGENLEEWSAHCPWQELQGTLPQYQQCYLGLAIWYLSAQSIIFK